MINNDPVVISELNTTHPQSICINQNYVNGSVNLNQNISFSTIGTYQLIFYAGPYQNHYDPTTSSLTASIAGTSTSAITFTPNTGFSQYTLNFTIGSAGSYNLSFLSINTDVTINSAMLITAVSIIYLHA